MSELVVWGIGRGTQSPGNGRGSTSFLIPFPARSTTKRKRPEKAADRAKSTRTPEGLLVSVALVPVLGGTGTLLLFPVFYAKLH